MTLCNVFADTIGDSGTNIRDFGTRCGGGVPMSAKGLLGRHDIVVEILWETAMDYLDYFTMYYQIVL